MKFKNKRVIKYITVLVVAIITRILFAIFAPIETQKYIGLIIILLAIAVFFIWDYMDGRKDKAKK